LENSIIKKLRIKEAMRIVIINAPEGYVKSLGRLPEKATIETGLKDTHDLVLLFVKNKAELNKMASAAARLLKPDASFWISFPKKSSGVSTDLNRDEGWRIMNTMNYKGVSLIAINETWSAGRFKLIENKAAGKRTKTSSERSSEDFKYIDQEKRIVIAPADLKAALNKNKTISEYFESLSFTNKKEYVRWIIQAKREETRKERVKRTIEKLLEGKRNPTEK
jgi:hypothetical protein